MRQLIKFGIVGGASTALHYAVFWGLLHVLNMAATPSTAIGYIVGSLLSYRLNYKYTFDSHALHSKALASFYVMVALGWVLNTGLVFIGTERLCQPAWPVQLTATAIVFFVNFVLSKSWVFKS